MFVLYFFLFVLWCCCFIFFFKQKTAYEMRISDWSSDVCSSDLFVRLEGGGPDQEIETAEIIHMERPPGRTVKPDACLTESGMAMDGEYANDLEIGRASCRERVCLRVDLGGSRIIKKKKHQKDDQLERVDMKITIYTTNNK